MFEKWHLYDSCSLFSNGAGLLFSMQNLFFCTFKVDLCSVAIEEDGGVVVGAHQIGGDSSSVFRELHTVMQLRWAVETQLCVVQLHHSRGRKHFSQLLLPVWTFLCSFSLHWIYLMTGLTAYFYTQHEINVAIMSKKCVDFMTQWLSDIKEFKIIYSNCRCACVMSPGWI